MKCSGSVLSSWEAAFLKQLVSSGGVGGSLQGGGGVVVRTMWKENWTTFIDHKHPIWSFLKIMDKQVKKNVGGNHK